MCTIRIESEHAPNWHGKIFGPFKTVPDAVKTLRKRGWTNDGTGPGRPWYACIDRYLGINARIRIGRTPRRSRVLSPKLIPTGVGAFLDE